MELDRQSISRSGERPASRWRREPESNEQSSENSDNGVVRSYSKMERPTSRRGVKTDITEYGISRPPTSSGRSALSHSGSIVSNRVPTPASRMGIVTPAIIPRTSSGLTRKAKVFDRPITQQGLAGIPTSSRNIPKLAKQIQDKRYYQQILEQKIQELNQEIETISHQVEKENNESTPFVDIDPKVKDSANELNILQGQLADYHITFDKMVAGINKEEIIQEVKEFKEFNDREEIQMKNIIQRRELAEKKLNELNKEIESRKKAIGNTNSEKSSRYDDLFSEKTELQKEMSVLQKQQNQLSDEKIKMQEKIALSPIKQEAYKLYLKINEIEKKRDKLLEEKKLSLTPENRRESYRKNIQENLDYSIAEQQIIEIEKKIADAQQELKKLENNEDEVETEKSTKNNESDEQDIMDIFKTSFEKTKIGEREKLKELKKEIFKYLEYIADSNTEGIITDLLDADEMEIIKLMDQNVENKDQKSFEELKQETAKLQQILNKLQTLGSKIITKTNITTKINNNQTSNDDSKTYDDEKKLGEEDQESFKQNKTNYRSKILDEHYKKLKEKFDENEIYRSISILEDKLIRISFNDEETLEFIKKQNESDKNDYPSLIERLVALTARYNSFLVNEMKSIY